MRGSLWSLRQHIHIEWLEKGCLCIFQLFQIQGRHELKRFHMCEWFHFSKMTNLGKTMYQPGEKEHIERNISTKNPNSRTYVPK